MKMHGFTLIELLVVIAIIGILVAAVSMSIFNGYSQRRDADRIANAALLQSTLEFYLAANGDFASILATDGTTVNYNGQIFTEAVYYSTADHPTGSGKHAWSELEAHLTSFARALPVDPRNDFADYLADGYPDYTSSRLLQGYMLVRLRDDNIDQLTGCSSPTYEESYEASYMIETVLEHVSHRSSNTVRQPRKFGCFSDTDGQSHLMTLWGTLE